VHVKKSCCKDHWVEPAASDLSEQRVRPAGVLLPKSVDTFTWVKLHLVHGLDKPAYSM